MDLQALSETARSAWVVWLMVLFIGIVYWAFRPKKRDRFENDAKPPFADDENGD
jgi:cytochrome c oxidase cbb3-type subunit 4